MVLESELSRLLRLLHKLFHISHVRYLCPDRVQAKDNKSFYFRSIPGALA
jgi:hypothetical protein